MFACDQYCCLRDTWLNETELSPQQPALELPALLTFANRKESPAQLCLDISVTETKCTLSCQLALTGNEEQ